MLHLSRLFFIGASLVIPGWSATVFDILLDTSSLGGSNGGIYFQFAGGLNPDPANVTVTNFLFSGPGALSVTAPLTNGGVSGTLPATVTLNNSTALNDYTHLLSFGTGIAFRVTFNLPLILSGSSGSVFAFGLTADDGLTPLLTSDPEGYMGRLSYNTSGQFAADLLSPQASLLGSQVPEPSATSLLAAPLVLIALRRRFKKLMTSGQKMWRSL